MKTLLLGIVIVLLGTTLIWLGQLLDFWWVALIIGLVVGFIITPARFALGLASLSGGVGWGLPLLYRATHLAIGDTAAVVASIVGIGSGNGWVIVVVTILLGALLCVCSAWVGVALRAVLGVRMRIV